MESLGPWKVHAKAPPQPAGSNAYATAFTAMVLLRTGMSPSDPKFGRALAWLRTHQDREHGYWNADSMNKQYEPDSVEIGFMRDAATGWASLVLLEAK
jgi:hypothetical protein